MADQPHPYFEGHPTGFEHLKPNDESGEEMRRICYELFVKNEDGRILMGMFLEKYLIPALYSPDHPNAQNIGLYFEGFKEAFRGLINMAQQHHRSISHV